MHVLENPYRGTGLSGPDWNDIPFPSTASDRVNAMLTECPVHAETPLVDAPSLAKTAGVASLHVKDERGRMGLGSFKALGAAYVVADRFTAAGRTPLSGVTLVTASAGNHGLSLAAGARVFGAKAVIYIAETVPEAFATRLRDKGAQVVREGAIYEDSMSAAQAAARDNGWMLISDSSWKGYVEAPHRLMEGYTQMAAEAVRQMPQPPTHILLQAGVGGLAAACAATFRAAWGDSVRIVVVEPSEAPALMTCIQAGHFVPATGGVSSMGRLDCKEASLIALKGLARDADSFLTLTDAEVEAHLPALAQTGLATTPSGGAGLAAALALGLDPQARVLTILSEGPEDA